MTKSHLARDLVAQHLFEARRETLFGLGLNDLAAHEPGERGDALVAQATGHDQVEAREIRVDVHGEAVGRDPAGDPYANGADFVLSHKGPALARDSPPDEAKVAADPDHHLFKITHIAVNIPTSFRDQGDGVTDHLARAVIRDVTPSPGLEKFDPASAQKVFADQKVLGSRVSPECHDGVVLEKEQGVDDLAPLSLIDQLLLERQTGSVRDPSQVPDIQRVWFTA